MSEKHPHDVDETRTARRPSQGRGLHLGLGSACFLFGLLVIGGGLGVHLLLPPELADDGLIRWAITLLVGLGALMSVAVVMEWVTGPQTVRREYLDETEKDAR